MNGVQITVYPSRIPCKLHGTLEPVFSKSSAHRILICASYALQCGSMEEVFVPYINPPEDIIATLECLAATGTVTYRQARSGFTLRAGAVSDATITDVVSGKQAQMDGTIPILPCGESGSTLRFMMPYAAAMCDESIMTGAGRLPQRRSEPLVQALRDNGANVHYEENDAYLPLRIESRISAGRYELPGGESSQYVSGLLMTLPYLKGRSEIHITSELKSSPYVDMTLAVLKNFGVIWSYDALTRTYSIDGGCRYKPMRNGVLVPEGDWSSAAFWICANAMGAEVECLGLDRNSAQGDRAVEALAKAVGGGAAVDVSNVPDLTPALAVVAACCEGTTHFTGTERLRAKESDRVQAIVELLRGVGVKAEAGDDFIDVYGGVIEGGTVNSYGDHRIAMAAAIAGAFSKSGVTIIDPLVTNKSYPRFYADFINLGGEVDGIYIR